MAKEKTVMVELETKSVVPNKDFKPKTKKFPIDQANAILKMAKPAWKLSDKGFEWNGSEIAKK